MSLLVGIAVWLLSALILYLLEIKDAWYWGVVAGAAVALVAYIFFMFTMHFHHNYRYRGIEATISDSVLLITNAYVRVEEVSRNGFLYLTAKKLICHFRDKKPYTEVIFQKESNWRVKLLSPVSFHLSDTKHTFEVVSTDALSMAEKMQALGWSVTVAPEQEQN